MSFKQDLLFVGGAVCLVPTVFVALRKLELRRARRHMLAVYCAPTEKK